MNQVKIMHCADIHLGMELQGIGSKSRIRKAEIKSTFLRIIKLCNSEAVDILLIAGDVFQNADGGKEYVSDIIDGLKELTHTKVYITPGNHDYINPASVYSTYEWPLNTHIFTGSREEIIVEELGVRIIGAGFTSQYVKTGLLTGLAIPEDDFINIGIFHGDLTGGTAVSSYNPISDSDIINSGLDYLALGHIHKQTDVLKLGKTYFAYSGCIEGQGFDETGIKGVYLGTLSKSECRLKYVRTCKRTYEILRITVRPGQNNQAIAEEIRNAAMRVAGTDYADNLYSVILSGEVSFDMYINVNEIISMLDEVFYIKVKDNTSIWISADEIAKDSSLKGVFAARMLEQIEIARKAGDNDRVSRYEKALGIGLKAFMGEVEYYED